MKRFYCLCYFLSLALASSAQRMPPTSGPPLPGNKGVVTTLPENQHPDLNIDGPGAMARFAAPTGIAVDANGVLYVADRYNHTIRRISATGIVSTLAGQAGNQGDSDGPGPMARFNHPTGVAVDAGGTVYVADRYNHTIRKISPAGMVTTLAGSAGNTGDADGIGLVARFNQPTGVTVNATGSVYVADCFNRSIRKITPKGEVTTYARQVTEVPGKVNKKAAYSYVDTIIPLAVTVSARGKVFLGCDGHYNADSIFRQISPVHGINPAIPLVNGLGLAIGNNGNMVAVDRDDIRNIVFQRSKKGRLNDISQGWYISCPGWNRPEDSIDGEIPKRPRGVAIDSHGNIFITDEESQNIVHVSGNGKVFRVLAGRGTRCSYGGKPFTLDSRAAVNTTGTMYVADASKHVIYQVSPAGVASVFAGSSGQAGTSNGTGSAARFWNPSAVAVDAAGTVYVADAGNHTIRQISPAGVVTTLAGSGSVGNTNGPAATARFYWPTGVAVDAAGTVYVADRGNHVIRQISAAGVVSTLAGRVGVPGIADGTGPSARFHDPVEVTVDAAGAVYVVDRGSRTMRVIR